MARRDTAMSARPHISVLQYGLNHMMSEVVTAKIQSLRKSKDETWAEAEDTMPPRDPPGLRRSVGESPPQLRHLRLRAHSSMIAAHAVLKLPGLLRGAVLQQATHNSATEAMPGLESKINNELCFELCSCAGALSMLEDWANRAALPKSSSAMNAEVAGLSWVMTCATPMPSGLRHGSTTSPSGPRSWHEEKQQPPSHVHVAQRPSPGIAKSPT